MDAPSVTPAAAGAPTGAAPTIPAPRSAVSTIAVSDPEPSRTCEQAAAGLTIPALLHRNATEFAALPALTQLGTDGPTLTWGELTTRVAEVSCGLFGLGLQPGNRMLIMMASRPEHWIVDLAATQIGAVPSTVYATLSPEQMRFVAQHSQAQVLVLEGAAEVARWRPILPDLPHVLRVVVVDESTVDSDSSTVEDARLVSLRQVAADGAEALAADPDAHERRWRAVRPEQPVTMLYTSGTTGDPKGVLLSHHNVVYQAAAIHTMVHLPDHAPTVAYLPLAHIAERILGIYNPIYRAMHVHICSDPTQLVAALRQVHPPGFFGVPRIWEKMVAGLQGFLAGAEERVRAGFNAASALALEAYRLREAGEPVPEETVARLAELDKAVLAPIRATLGLDNVTWAGSGAAPIPVDVLLFLAGLGIDVLEVWGMTETTGTATINTTSRFKTGKVGRPNAGMEIRIAEDGEILARGPQVCLGYLQADGSTKPVTDEDGWLATGDVGVLDEDGFLTITDRKKELIITSGGKNIAPAQIENLLRVHPLIAQAVAIGDRRAFVTALIVLDDEAVPVWAKARGLEQTDTASLATNPAVLEEISAAIQEANAKLSRPEQVKAFRILPNSWTPVSGEVTPTLKLRRRVITDRYADTIDSMYGG